MSIDFSALDSIPAQPEVNPGGAMYRLNREKQERDSYRQMCATYQRNIQRAGTLRTDITKGIQNGEDPLALLLKAVECISLMTGDTAMYTQSKEDLLAVYGWGLGVPEAIEHQLEDARERLAMLERPELQEAPEDTQKRIQRAIEAHRELIKKLGHTTPPYRECTNPQTVMRQKHTP